MGHQVVIIQVHERRITQIRDVNAKHGLGKASILHCNAILGATRGYRKRMIETGQECVNVMALEGVTKRTEHHRYSIDIYLQEQRMVTRT